MMSVDEHKGSSLDRFLHPKCSSGSCVTQSHHRKMRLVLAKNLAPRMRELPVRSLRVSLSSAQKTILINVRMFFCPKSLTIARCNYTWQAVFLFLIPLYHGQSLPLAASILKTFQGLTNSAWEPTTEPAFHFPKR
jgi:hypothetical protein